MPSKNVKASRLSVNNAHTHEYNASSRIFSKTSNGKKVERIESDASEKPSAKSEALNYRLEGQKRERERDREGKKRRKKMRKKKGERGWNTSGAVPAFLTYQDIDFDHELLDKFRHSAGSTSRSYARSGRLFGPELARGWF